MLSNILDYILIPTAHADGVTHFIGKVNEHVLNPLIMLLFALAFVLFTVGLFKFFGSRENAEDLETGKKNIMWGVVGMAIMVSVFGIMSFITSSIGLKDGAVSGIREGGTGDVTSLFDGSDPSSE